MEPTEQELLEEARKGDRTALEDLLALEQPRIYRFGMKMCGHPEDAADVLQETMLAVARNVGDFRGNSSLSTWLYKIARSFCIKKHRRSKYAPEREESLESGKGGDRMEVEADQKFPDEQVASRQVQKVLQGAIDSLDPMYREVLVLRDVEGLRATEVAEVTGISVQAVKSRLHRARVAIRDKTAPVLGMPVVAEPAVGTCQELVAAFTDYVEGDLSPDACSRMEKHLAECEQCHGACDALKKTVALCRDAPTPEVSQSLKESVRDALQSFLNKDV